MDYRVFRNHPLCRHGSLVVTRGYDATVNNPYLLDHPGRDNPSKGLIHPPKDMPPFEKEDFERVVYDFYEIEQYEYHHPEIVKNHDVWLQLEELTKKKGRQSALAPDPQPNEPPNIEKENSASCGDLTPWVERAVNYCIAQKKEHGQLPTKDEVCTHLEQLLTEEGVLLGRYKKLPDAIFRQIWKDMPKSCKRKIGERSK